MVVGFLCFSRIFIKIIEPHFRVGVTRVEVINAVTFPTSNPFGEVSGEFLQLLFPLIVLPIEVEDLLNYSRVVAMDTTVNSPSSPRTLVYWDDNVWVAKEYNVALLLFQVCDKARIDGLVLQPTG